MIPPWAREARGPPAEAEVSQRVVGARAGAWKIGDRVAVAGLRRPDGVVVASLIEARGAGPAQVAGPVRQGADGHLRIASLRLVGAEPGLAGSRALVTGTPEGGALKVAGAAEAGLPMTLTKPLGVGLLNNRMKSTGEVSAAAIEVMTTLNRDASKAALAAGAKAATDAAAQDGTPAPEAYTVVTLRDEDLAPLKDRLEGLPGVTLAPDHKLISAGIGGATVDAVAVAAYAREHLRTLPDPLGRDTSARNRLVGIVTAITSDTVMSQVELQCGPFRVVSLMSTEAVRETGLELGSVAVAVIKSTQVVVETRISDAP